MVLKELVLYLYVIYVFVVDVLGLEEVRFWVGSVWDVLIICEVKEKSIFKNK